MKTNRAYHPEPKEASTMSNDSTAYEQRQYGTRCHDSMALDAMIRFRLRDRDKQRFYSLCRLQGQDGADVLRAFVQDFAAGKLTYQTHLERTE